MRNNRIAEGPYRTGVEVTYECIYSYELVGPSINTCTGRGEWFFQGIEVPKCVKRSNLHFVFYKIFMVVCERVRYVF